MKAIRWLILGVFCLPFGLSAAVQSFDFEDPEGLNAVRFVFDGVLGGIAGMAHGVTGKVEFNPENPQSLKGSISVDVRSFHLENPSIEQRIIGYNGLDAKNDPIIHFKTSGIRNVKRTSPTEIQATVTGTITIKGVTKPIAVPARITYLKDRLQDRTPDLDGDLLVIRTRFLLRQKDFGIQEGSKQDTIADRVEINLSIAGFSPH